MTFTHLEAREDVLGGKPCVKGTRISVQVLLEWLASGSTREDILQTYPHISGEAFNEALQFAANQMNNEVYFEIQHAA